MICVIIGADHRTIAFPRGEIRHVLYISISYRLPVLIIALSI